ncbi:CHAT domain-containing protein [Algoriphagus sp.]|uniref:CHAT domain-containing protein n=1 Tax=Algoriphagus sp. TaxID=1872435 RepID=UPI0025E183BE|nr:CHAT domain-containing protein [Algoriphagus sp.]
MQSILIEYLRFDDLATGVLMPEKSYLRLKASEPVGSVKITIGHKELLQKLYDLRYEGDFTPEEKQEKIVELSKLIKSFMADFSTDEEGSIQIDLVLNPSELGLLPFELLLDDQNEPWFTKENKEVILTRRIRQNFIAKEEKWPIVPKVLFVYSNPTYGSFREVPWKQHRDYLRWALKPWISEDMVQTDENDVLTIIHDASLADLKNKIGEADQSGKPFTHIHILAHGTEIIEPFDREFGVALSNENQKPTKVEEFVTIFDELKVKPFTVTYCICDSGNFISPISGEKNIVHSTHKRGVPIVIGSQLPLSFGGAKVIVRDFYNSLLGGEDVRRAIHKTRCNLYSTLKETHDWMSMVAYVRLPEGYTDYLLENNIKRELAALKTIRSNADRLIENQTGTIDDFDTLINDLNSRIRVLATQIDNDNGRDSQLSLEMVGLMGSTSKRLAEIYYYKSKLGDAVSSELKSEQRKNLEESLKSYKKASISNLSHHWSLVQFISLHYVLNGKVLKKFVTAAEIAIEYAINENPNEIWAYGSQLELGLLMNQSEGKLKATLNKLVEQVKKMAASENFPLRSTHLQLMRYKEWWIKDNGFFELKERSKLEKLISEIELTY